MVRPNQPGKHLAYKQTTSSLPKQPNIQLRPSAQQPETIILAHTMKYQYRNLEFHKNKVI